MDKKMVEMGSYISVMTINVNRLYSVKRQTVTLGIKTTV